MNWSGSFGTMTFRIVSLPFRRTPSEDPSRRAMLQMLAIFAEMERSFIVERTTAGLAAAKAQGRTGGRPKALDGKRAKQAQALRSAGELPADIARTLGVSVATIYRLTKA